MLQDSQTPNGALERSAQDGHDAREAAKGLYGRQLLVTASPSSLPKQALYRVKLDGLRHVVIETRCL